MILSIKALKRYFAIAYHKEGEIQVYGYTNRCSDGKFIIFLDYDRIPLYWVEQEIQYLQKDYGLGHFYIFQSSQEGMHAICFSKVTMSKLKEILRNSSVDENYYTIPYTIGKKLLTLRLTNKGSKKIQFIERILHKSNRKESREHKVLMNKLFNFLSCEELINNNDDRHKSELIFSNYSVSVK